MHRCGQCSKYRNPHVLRIFRVSRFSRVNRIRVSRTVVRIRVRLVITAHRLIAHRTATSINCCACIVWFVCISILIAVACSLITAVRVVCVVLLSASQPKLAVSALSAFFRTTRYRTEAIQTRSHREVARCFVSLNISLSHSRSFKMTLLSKACGSRVWVGDTGVWT